MPKVRRPSPAPSPEPDRVPGILRDRHTGAPPECNPRSGYPGDALREPNVMGCKILIAAIRA